MGPEDFNAVIDETLSRLPEWVHDAMENIAIEVLDAPDESFAEYGASSTSMAMFSIASCTHSGRRLSVSSMTALKSSGPMTTAA